MVRARGITRDLSCASGVRLLPMFFHDSGPGHNLYGLEAVSIMSLACCPQTSDCFDCLDQATYFGCR